MARTSPTHRAREVDVEPSDTARFDSSGGAEREPEPTSGIWARTGRRDQTIAGRYRLGEILGRGGTSVVWRAIDVEAGEPVAVKLLDRPHTRDRVEEFLREAELIAAVSDPSVVRLLGSGMTLEREPFIVMELLEGETLAARLSRAGALSASEVMQIAGGILRALAAIHAQSIIHSDVKPENVFLVGSGDSLAVKLFDFGVSRSRQPEIPSPVETCPGLVLGTLAYMAPEQVRGCDAVDYRTDLYSVGAIMYECLAQRLPFLDERPSDLLFAVATRRPPSLGKLRPDLDPRLLVFVERAMAFVAAKRFQSAREMRKALDALAAQL